jgi:hypothetical protein
MLAVDGDPPIDRQRLRAAEQLRGEDFDECVRATIDEAGSSRVRAAYLRARVGGPRWKLQASLRRLVDAGVLERSGSTNATRYRRAKTSPWSDQFSLCVALWALVDELGRVTLRRRVP